MHVATWYLCGEVEDIACWPQGVHWQGYNRDTTVVQQQTHGHQLLGREREDSPTHSHLLASHTLQSLSLEIGGRGLIVRLTKMMTVTVSSRACLLYIVFR